MAWAMSFVTEMHLQGEEIGVLVYCPGGIEGSRVARHCNQLGVPVETLDTSICDTIEAQVEWTLRQCRHFRPKVLIANLVLPAMFASRWLRPQKIATVGVIHSDPQHDSFYREVLDVFVAGAKRDQLDAVVPVSRRSAEVVAMSNRRGDVGITTIPCGTRRSHCQASPPSSALRLIYAGRLVEKAKRIRATVDALLQACQRPDVTASICGDGDQREWLQHRLFGQDHVRYLGEVSQQDMMPLMCKHHAIVLLSDFEGMPISLLEGMSCGLVPICTRAAGGAAEVIDDGVNGFLVDDRQRGLAQAVEQLRDPDTWQRMSQAAMARVTGEYLHEITFAKWRSLLNELSAGRVPNCRRLPFRIDLREYSHRFTDYPGHRPSLLRSTGDRIAQGWHQTRQLLRPRARLRKLLHLHRQNSN
jgi:glycosyltransferase involved in cell wall biosynthesis